MRTKHQIFSPKVEKKESEHHSVFGYTEPLWGQPGGGVNILQQYGLSSDQAVIGSLFSDIIGSTSTQEKVRALSGRSTEGCS